MNRFLLIATLVFPCAMNATTVYSAFGTNNSYTAGFISPVYNDIDADEFSPSSSGYLNQITLALGVSEIADAPSYADIFIYANNGGEPGTILEEIKADAGSFNDADDDPSALLVTVNSVLAPYLSSGQSYWLGVSAVAPGTNPIELFGGATGLQPGKLEETFYQGAWVLNSPQPSLAIAASITVSSNPPAPEPATFILLGTSLLGVVLMRRRAGAVKLQM